MINTEYHTSEILGGQYKGKFLVVEVTTITYREINSYFPKDVTKTTRKHVGIFDSEKIAKLYAFGLITGKGRLVQWDDGNGTEKVINHLE